MSDENKDWADRPQAAAHLGITTRTLTHWQNRRLVPFYRVGRCIRFKLSELDAHLARNSRVEAVN